MAHFSDIKVLTFDLFGTILDLGSSLTPFIEESFFCIFQPDNA